MRPALVLTTIALLTATSHADPRAAVQRCSTLDAPLAELVNENQELIAGASGPLTRAQTDGLRKNARAFTRQVAIGGSILSSVKLDATERTSVKASFDKGIMPSWRRLEADNRRFEGTVAGRTLVTVADARALIGEIRLLHGQAKALAGKCAALGTQMR